MRVQGRRRGPALRRRAPEVILDHLEHGMPLYGVEPLDTEAMGAPERVVGT